ncbi:muconate/chloromuconate family cycloisomerase [Phytohabitans sp. ZYX-F-186]|uniref:Muconate/chloromuconate family cycloisomerase n=1 Tax=Phytohabitans maris TaxID=3071409 RepID=A0ABU0ZUQ4_9ACTN|nr:muconate/chloromuconate family cycloisomerase [Phytohabitans sp. ZYX-F-186]MDQ7909905.1 muconate/chloromuconate family cycloisomerase [Phytohabitans sp. ZYX-F-186]
MLIDRVSAVRVRIPYRRSHTQSFGPVPYSEAVFVRVSTDSGVEGFGEACVPAGPYWNEESAESMLAACEVYLGPRLVGADPRALGAVQDRMRVVSGNHFAKNALEMACLDIAGRAAGVPAHDLLGGVRRRDVPIIWSLGIGDAAAELDEMAEMHERYGIEIFKVKVGHEPLAHDLERLSRLAGGLDGRVRLRPDANQGWDEATALRALPVLEQLGIEALEQPLPRWNLTGLARLRNASRVPLMADESVLSPQDALTLAREGAVDLFALKLAKSGGTLPTMAIAAIAEAAGIGCYMGCMVESGLGTAGYLHACAAVPDLRWGCALLGPLLLAEEVLTEPIRFANGRIFVPDGPGLGVLPDWDAVHALAVG